VGNACIYALGNMLQSGGVTQLAILKVKVKSGTTQKLLERELTRAAERLGMAREEVEELAVPAHGLDEVGRRREPLGDFTAELTVRDTRSIDLCWIKPDGKAQKSVPAAVKRDHADALKQLKADVKEIEKMLPVQRERIDGLFLQQRSWPLAAWRERYLDHPLVGAIARRIIWRFQHPAGTSEGIWCDGRLVGRDDRPLELGDGTNVELWHPIDRPPENVLAWRDWLERHEVQQPFKQAHREIYLLTDAERETNVYSNRFAAHVLKQSQFRALARTRGWTAEFLGPWDGSDVGSATRPLPSWALAAEFCFTPAGEDFAESAGFLYVSTDQVRFRRLEEGKMSEQPIPLADVPPLVLSEVMRDVDLFVGVASVAADPSWSDGGPDDVYRDYWQNASFGGLSTPAQTRRDVLERLIPRLAIADRCTLGDRFLVVRGDLRTYKIHLGSSNILMAPNDEYLCIVPDHTRKSTERVFLPFEGDPTLSLILSKAFLLADDAKITDQTIVSQIGARKT
jgi:hypothetical protein